MKHPRLIFFIGFLLLGLILGSIQFIPDGKLHIYFCDVGQGDAMYIRFPNSIDMLIDGGPNNRVLQCLSAHMPFFDRKIEIVALTHPQTDHYAGLIEVFKRYDVGFFITVPVGNSGESYQRLVDVVKNKAIRLRYLTEPDEIKVGDVTLTVLWPDKEWLISDLKQKNDFFDLANFKNQTQLVMFYPREDINQYSLYLCLTYKNFNALFTGDGDIPLQRRLQELGLFAHLPQHLSVLKVPHHGSRTAMLDETIDKLHPQVSIVEVGKNSYGHPHQNLLDKLQVYGPVLTTQQFRTIEVKTDGNRFQVLPQVP